MLASFADWRLCRGEEGLRDRLREGGHAIGIADHDIARMDDHAADGDGDVDLARAVLVGPEVDAGAGEAGKAGLRQGVEVAYRPVEHEARSTAHPRDRGHDLADEGAAHVGAAIDDDDIARADHFECLVDGAVIARADLHRQRRARHRRAVVKRAQPDRAGDPVQVVADIGDLELAEGRDQFGLCLGGIGADAFFEHGRISFHCRAAQAWAISAQPSSMVSSEVAKESRR